MRWRVTRSLEVGRKSLALIGSAEAEAARWRRHAEAEALSIAGLEGSRIDETLRGKRRDEVSA